MKVMYLESHLRGISSDCVLFKQEHISQSKMHFSEDDKMSRKDKNCKLLFVIEDVRKTVV